MKKLKRIISVLMCMAMCLTLTGCDLDCLHDNVKLEFESRVDQNKAYIKLLKDAGVIDKSTEDQLNKHFKSYDDFMNDIKNSDGKRLNTMTTYIYPGCTNSTIKGLKVSGDDTVEPYGAKAGENGLFPARNIKVYKAKHSALKDGIDELSKAVKEIEKLNAEGKTSEALAKIDFYFDNTDQDLFPTEIPLLVATKENKTEKNEFGRDFVIYEKKKDGDKEVANAAIDVRILEINKKYVDIVTQSSSYTNEGGKYVLIGNKALLVSYPVSYVKTIKQDGDKWKAETAESGLLLNIVTGGLSKYDTSKGCVETTYSVVNNANKVLIGTEADVNLLLGKADDDQVKELTEITETTGQNPDGTGGTTTKKVIQTLVNNAKNGVGFKLPSSKLFNSSSPLSNSSYLVVPGASKKMKYKEVVNDKKDAKGNKLVAEFEVEYNEIILKDYLEFVPTPNYTDPYTPLGRRFRFKSDFLLNGATDTDTVGLYIDNSGSNMFPLGSDSSMSTLPIKIGDFIDKSSTKDKVTLLKKDADSTTPEVAASGEIPEGLVIGIPPVTQKFAQSIEVCFPFPGDVVASSDKANITTNSKPLLYGAKIFKDPFETSVYSMWLMSDSETNSVVWWDNWLKANGYIYSLDLNALRKSSQQALDFEREKKETIKLDMDVIEKIQDDIDEENTIDKLALIRTIFFILGIILLFYGLLVPCAWLFDTNVPMGPKLLTILTFGKWVAVPRKDEYCDKDDNVHYVDMKDIIIGTIIIIAAGALLTTFDVIQLIIKLITSCASLAKWLWNMIFR